MKDYDETCCPNCGNTKCTEECETELARHIYTINKKDDEPEELDGE